MTVPRQSVPETALAAFRTYCTENPEELPRLEELYADAIEANFTEAARSLGVERKRAMARLWENVWRHLVVVLLRDEKLIFAAQRYHQREGKAGGAALLRVPGPENQWLPPVAG